jgi:hypothetical protein
MSPAIRGCILFPAAPTDIEAQATILLKRDTSVPEPSAAAVAPRPDLARDIECIDHHDTPPPDHGDTRPLRRRAFTLADARTLIAPRYRRIAQWLSGTSVQYLAADLFQSR